MVMSATLYPDRLGVVPWSIIQYDTAAALVLSSRLPYPSTRFIYNNEIQWDAVITLSIFAKILTMGTPYLAREGELWGAFCEYKLWLR